MIRFLIAVLLSLINVPALAQSILRDAEIEQDLRTIADPIFTAAGLNAKQVRIVVLNDDTINAFVAGGQNLFLYSGLLLETKDVGQLGGVIAHESGHMAGGHLIRLKGEMSQASVETILSTLAGIAVGVGSGSAQAGVASVMGGNELARRRMLSHSRVYESSADQAGLQTLNRLGYSAQGMADFLEHLSGEEILPEMQRSGYILTHPLSRERLETVEAFVAKQTVRNKPWPPQLQELFLRVQAKILAFTQPQRAQQVFKDKNDANSRYGYAIALYRQGHIAEALQLIDVLEKAEPHNAFLPELRGQILFEQGRIADATTAYDKAVTLAPEVGLLHFELAQALLQNDKTASAAIPHLLQARDKGESRTPLLYRWLAIGYGKQGKNGLAKLSLAEEALLRRDMPLATMQATAAKKDLPKDDATTRQRADDILAQAGHGR